MSRGEPIPWHIILFVGVVMMLVVFVCSGCFGVAQRGKTMRIQVPALLDVEIDYVDGPIEPPIEKAEKWRDSFVPTKKATVQDIFDLKDPDAAPKKELKDNE